MKNRSIGWFCMCVREKNLHDPYQPIFSLSTQSLTLNLNKDNGYSDLQMFTFSASNLQKTLYCKWEHSSSVLFRYEYENKCMEILAGDYELELNGSVHFPAGFDYEDEEVLVAVDNLYSTGNYTTKLHFYSYEKDSKEELAIDEYVTILVQVSDPLETKLANTPIANDMKTRKELRNGHIFIVKDNQLYDLFGRKVK